MPETKTNRPRILDRQIPGRDLELLLIDALGTVRTHTALPVGWHSHECYELHFLLEGATTYEFRDQPSVNFSGGHFLLIPRGMVHRGAYEIRMPVVMVGFQFDPERRQAWRHTVFTRAEIQGIAKLLQGIPLASCPMHRELRRVVTRMMEEAEEFLAGRQDAASRASLRGLVCLALVEATRQLASPSKAGPTELVAAAEAYLSEHLAEPVRMNDLARHLGLSRARVFELFKSATGLTPNDYLIRQRIDRGCQLLTTTKRSVTDIALACGFSSSQYFSNVFWKYTRMRPTEYRRKYTRGS